MDITHNDKNGRIKILSWRVLLCLPCLFASQTVLARDWEFNPQVTMQELYSSNIELASDGAEQHDFVTELTPALAIRGRGARYRANINYALQGLIYEEDSGRNDINHLLTGTGELEFLRDHGFINMGINYSPQNTSNNGIIALDNISVTPRPRILTYNIGPSWRQEFGNFALGSIGYSFDQVITDTAGLADSTAHTVTGNIHSGPHFTDWNWRLNALEQYVDESDADNVVRFRNVTGRADYYFVPHWAVIGQLGYDDNRFSSADTDTSGVLWGTGLKWSPARETSFEVIGGERFFGRAFSARAEHTGRRFRFLGSYTEEPTTTRATLLRNTTFALVDAFGQPIIDPNTGQPQTLSAIVPVQTAEVLISRIFDSVFGYTGRFHDFDFRFAHENRDFQSTGDNERVLTATAAWRWRFTPRTSSRIAFSWIDEDLRAQGNGRFAVLDFAITRQFGRGLEATLGGRYLDRVTSGLLPEYDETRAFLMLVKTF